MASCDMTNSSSDIACEEEFKKRHNIKSNYIWKNQCSYPMKHISNVCARFILQDLQYSWIWHKYNDYAVYIEIERHERTISKKGYDNK